MPNVADVFAIAVQQHQAGFLPQAAQHYQQILRQEPNHAGALNLMGVIACQTGQLVEGVAFYQRSLAAKPDFAEAHYNLALALQMLGQISDAIAHYRTTLSLQPNRADVHNQLGLLLTQLGQIETGMGHYRQALAVNPDYVTAHINLGALLASQGQTDAAIAHLQRAVALQPSAVQAHLYLGHLWNQQGRLDAAEQRFRRALALQPDPQTHYNLGKTLEEQGQVDDAIAQYRSALQLQPDFAEAEWQQHLILPVLYTATAQSVSARQRFCRGLNHLIRRFDLTTSDGQQQALKCIGSRTNFYLAYQGLNDRGLQCKYGQFVHQVMAANYPQWVKPLPKRFVNASIGDTSSSTKLRVGYLSAHMMAHSAAAWVRGWLRAHDRQQFEVIGYHIGPRVDSITQEIRSLCDEFRHVPGEITAIATQVRADDLDILVLTDIGMDPKTTQLAGLRLVPVQCTAWGHPVTSGIPTIDYYLSSNLMEPETAQQHYSEQLVRLPNIGISYPKPPAPTTQATRSTFGLREDAVLYLSFQSPYKYLPAYDWVFAQIAQQVPNAQFVFLRHASQHAVAQFQQRLQQAFAAVGLTSAAFCVFLPKLDRDTYWALNQVCDVFLDTFAWSGGNSTLEAIAYGLPVVTCPGQFMRGRHSAAILTMLGVTATIAPTPADYIDIAVRLGQDASWRHEISQTIVTHHDRLYDDVSCVKALEAFYQQVARSPERIQGTDFQWQ